MAIHLERACRPTTFVISNPDEMAQHLITPFETDVLCVRGKEFRFASLPSSQSSSSSSSSSPRPPLTRGSSLTHFFSWVAEAFLIRHRGNLRFEALVDFYAPRYYAHLIAGQWQHRRHLIASLIRAWKVNGGRFLGRDRNGRWYEKRDEAVARGIRKYLHFCSACSIANE
jgi:hypothetical protein